MLKQLLATTLMLFSASAMAWMCPNNFNQIQVGDTLATIEQQCGKPTLQTSTEKEASVPQDWTYYVQNNQPSSTPAASMPGSIKLTLAFVNDRVVNIMVQGNSLTSTSICGPTVSVGDNSATIEAACGKTTFINKYAPQNGAPKPTEIIEYNYGSAPLNTLIFENGILKDRK